MGMIIQKAKSRFLSEYSFKIYVTFVLNKTK